MGGKGGQTIGYRYFMAKHDGICRGPVNEFVTVRVGDLVAYDTDGVGVSTGGFLALISKPKLFGGKKKEGGIVGPMWVAPGHVDQVWPGAMSTGLGTLPSIKAILGGDVPEFRGIVTTWFDGEICSNNPYPKEWAYRVRRWNAGWYNDDPWYPVMARQLINGPNGIIKAMNGAHILVECNTDPQWGRGMPRTMLDLNSYMEAANKLCEEGMGLCFFWFRQESIREYIQTVIDHIAGVQYVDRETGLMTLRLIRDDYVVEDLPLYGPDTGLLDVRTDDSSGEEVGFNEIIVKGFDPSVKKEISIRGQNIGSIQALDGEIISVTKEFRGFSTEEQLAKVAVRELRSQIGLRKLTLIMDRRAWRIAPGMPFRITFPDKNIGEMVVRPGEIKDGTLVNGEITMSVVEDVFGVPLTVYIDQPTDQWTPPDYTPVPPSDSLMVEANYRDVYLRTTEEQRSQLDEGDSLIAMIAAAPPGVVTNGYDLATRTSTTAYPDPDGDTVLPGGSWTPSLILAADVAAFGDTTVASVEEDGMADFASSFTPGMVALIGTEQVEITDVDDVAMEITFNRGVADTVPVAHGAGDRVWLIDDEAVTDGIQYAEGETVFGKALTQTAQDGLDLVDAVEKNVTTVQRVNRPFPPGNVKVDGDSIYEIGLTEHPDFILTWSHRDRLLQMDQVVDHVEGSIGPEAGTTYNIRVFSEDGTTEIYSDNVGSVDTWDFSVVTLTTEDFVWVELESERDGLTSFQMYRFKVILNATGWGFGWGFDWGGT